MSQYKQGISSTATNGPLTGTDILPWQSSTPPWGTGAPPWVTAGTLPTAVASLVAHSFWGSGQPSELAGHSATYFQELGGILIGVPCMLLVLCALAVGGRLLARRMARVSLEADDWITVFALVSQFRLNKILC